MGKRPTMTTEEYLTSAPLPEQTDTYTVISHKTVIDATRKTLESMGFEIEREFYRCNEGALVASGVYHLKYSDDADIGMLFAWANSYDKSMKFHCSVGGYVHESLAAIIGGNMGSWGRKHTGNADEEALETIKSQLINAEDYFKELLIEKERMKNIPIAANKRAEILGRMYFEHELLTTEQMSVIKQEFIKPSFIVGGIDNSLWKTYHAIVYSLQRSHPKTWMTQQKLVHTIFQEEFLQVVPPIQDSVITENKQEVNPMQLTIEDVIKEIESEQLLVIAEDAQEFVQYEPDGSALAPTDVEVSISVEEEGWPCVQCGTMQGPTSIWNDGQLCSTCFNKN